MEDRVLRAQHDKGWGRVRYTSMKLAKSSRKIFNTKRFKCHRVSAPR